MLVKVVFNNERNREPEFHQLQELPVPSSIYKLNIDGVRYTVTNIEEFADSEEVAAEIRVSRYPK